MKTATNRIRHVLGSLRCAFDGLSDGELLAHFVATQDEMAFARLVRMHGPMVLSICTRVLQHDHDAEDAFQATFLILARKGRSVVQGDAIGGWLYRVAYRTAQEARAMRARRRAKEVHVDTLPHPEVPAAEPHDWRSVLDQELSLLPAKYQSAIVLCDLEARARKEAAQELGIPEGTLSSRLAHGRKLLAARLARRGITLGAGALAAALSANGASAQLPLSLVSKTANAAALVAAGKLAAVSTPVAVLMKGVLKSMFIAKLKTVAGFFALAALALGFGSAAYQTGGAQQGPAPANQSIAKPFNELEALRRENELLRLNLQVVLEKVHAQELELRAYRSNAIGSAAAEPKSAGPKVRWTASAVEQQPKQNNPYSKPASEAKPKQAGPSVQPEPAARPDGPSVNPALQGTPKPDAPKSNYNLPISPANPFQEQPKQPGSQNKSVSGAPAPRADFFSAESDDARRQFIQALEQEVQRLQQELNRIKKQDAFQRVNQQ